MLTWTEQYEPGSEEEFCSFISPDRFVEDHNTYVPVDIFAGIEASNGATATDSSLELICEKLRPVTLGMMSSLLRMFSTDLKDVSWKRNENSLFETLDNASYANVDKETYDSYNPRSISPERIVEVLSQRVSQHTVSDAFTAEALTFRYASTPSAPNEARSFLWAMTLWCTIAWRIGITSGLSSVIMLLHEYGVEARAHHFNDCRAIRDEVLIQVNAIRVMFGPAAVSNESMLFSEHP